MRGSPKSIAVGFLVALSVAGSAWAETSGSTSGASAYDGTWSVVVSSKDGLCSGAYRYPVAIVNGTVRHAAKGNHDFDIRGNVQADGRVTVRVGSGDLRADGVGRLTQSAGSGTWRSPSGCTGRWQATRRA